MSKQFLSDLVHYRTYAKYIPELQRRENKKETIDRNLQMHLDKFPQFTDDIVDAYQEVYAGRVVPSMRAMQFSGEPIRRRAQRQYNCCYLPIESFRDFRDLFMMSMSGVGVGYSVRKVHVYKLPKITRGEDGQIFVIPDSAEGWCESLLFLLSNPQVKFDYSQIRKAGSPLSTGGQASGPRALMKMHGKVREVLHSAEGRQLTSIEVHRICCLIAEAVVVGGVRRAAMLSIFDPGDSDMLSAKTGNWTETYPEFARANNSASVLKNGRESQAAAAAIIDACFKGGWSEPGLLWTNNEEEYGWNACSEIALTSRNTCNLTEVNTSICSSPEEFYNSVRAASIIGTLQASYTDFVGIQKYWQEMSERDALLGVSLTGQAESQSLLTDDLLRRGAKLSVDVNREWSKKVGINRAARITTVKPSGTASSWLGTTAGVHAGHELHYLRRVRLDKDTPLGHALMRHYEEFVVDDPFSETNLIISIPVRLKEDTLLRKHEASLQLLERVKRIYQNWILPGHIRGDNTHNVSLTVSYLPHERSAIKKWMLENRDYYHGIALAPHDMGNYQYTPYSPEIHPEVFAILERRFNRITEKFNFDVIKERTDHTDVQAEAACSSGGSCDLR